MKDETVYEIVDNQEKVLYVVLKYEDFLNLKKNYIDFEELTYQQLTKEEFIFDLKNNKL
jgi:hypothetical protein